MNSQGDCVLVVHNTMLDAAIHVAGRPELQRLRVNTAPVCDNVLAHLPCKIDVYGRSLCARVRRLFNRLL